MIGTEGFVRIERALISVSDKFGIVELAEFLLHQGVEILSTGGTADKLREGGIEVTDVSAYTGFPEMMEGRLKTLHPLIHGAILFKRGVPLHEEAAKAHGIKPIDLIVVNLYPFEQTVAKKGVTFEQAIEQIDIGGPAMLRGGSKNSDFVTVLSDPSDYPLFIDQFEQNDGGTMRLYRRRQMGKLFERSAAYESAIARYLQSQGY